MFIYGAIGDGYGAYREFVEVAKQPPNTGNFYGKHPVLPLGGGKYTDDGQMLSAVGKVMLETRPGALPTADDFAKQFYTSYTQDPRPGYSKGFEKILKDSFDWQDMVSKLGTGSTRSGAPMRAAAVGGYKDVEQVKLVSAIQCKVTHDSPIAIECSQAIALAAHYLIHRLGDRKKIGDFLNYHRDQSLGIDWNEDRTEWATVEAVDCSRNAITAWRGSRTVTDVLVRSVAPGGDTDTVACIAMCLAWCDPFLKDDLNTDLFDEFEPGSEYGFEYLFDLTHAYATRFLV